jgi:hypothetical protein
MGGAPVRLANDLRLGSEEAGSELAWDRIKRRLWEKFVEAQCLKCGRGGLVSSRRYASILTFLFQR